MENISPLETPEISAMVGRYLDRVDLVRCLRVCKLWLNQFLPLVWSTTVIVKCGRRKASKESLHRHRLLIRNLQWNIDLYRESEYEDMSFDFPNLTTLELDGTTVVPQHPRSPTSPRDDFPTSVWERLYKLQKLSRLKVYRATVPETLAPAFWQLCTLVD